MSFTANLGVSRRSFVVAGLGGAAGLTLSSRSAHANRPDEPSLSGFPHQDPTLVRETVSKSHFDLEAVRELVTARPELAKASWDWGFGDWESALGAASHTGRREIAEVLITHGARPNLFTHAMMGNLKAVKAVIETQPGVQRIPGPHGITLLAHARAGGDEAKDVLAYLEELGDADPVPINEPLTTEEMNGCLGTFTIETNPGAGAGATFEIIESRGMLAVKHPDIPNRPLFHQGEHEFHPSGAPSFRFRFEFREGSAVQVALGHGDTPAIAKRVM